MGKAGKREYVQVLRLMENFEMVDVHGAVRQALGPAGHVYFWADGTWAPLVTMRSSIYCSAAFKSDRQGWTWIFIPTCPGPVSRQQSPQSI